MRNAKNESKSTCSIIPSWLIDNIAEASKNARSIYFVYIGFITYCALTVVGTTDRQLVLNETARLPIINMDVSINGFFILAPLLAIGIFIYFQLYLQRLNGLIRDLRTNYAPIEKRRLYPWMLNIAEDPEPGFAGRVQRFVVQLTLWWSLPVVLLLFAMWVVKKHELLISYIVTLLPLLGLVIVFVFWHYYENPGGRLDFGKSFFKEQRSKKRTLAVLGAGLLIAEFALLFVFIPFAKNFKTFCVDLSNQVLAKEPEKDYKNLYWHRLNGAHLEGANFSNSVLKRADLRGAHLQNADFRNAILDEANFTGADLEGADLRKASLERTIFQAANLRRTNLQGSNLFANNLRDADIREANFKGAHLNAVAFIDADLRKTNFIDSDWNSCSVRGANFSGTDFTAANLHVYNLNEAKLDSANFTGASIIGSELKNARLAKTIFTNAVFSSGQFEGATLKDVDFRGANLRDAVFRNAKFLGQTTLTNADLQRADLRGSNLTASQLSQVETLFHAKLDSNILVQISKLKPELFTKPNDR